MDACQRAKQLQAQACYPERSRILGEAKCLIAKTNTMQACKPLVLTTVKNPLDAMIKAILRK